MAVVWIDGFDNYGTSGVPSPTNIVARRYAITALESNMLIRDGRFGEYGIVLNNNPTCYISPGPLTTNATLIVGFAFKFPSLPWASGREFLSFYDGTTLGINVKTAADGQFSIYLGTSLVATSTSAAIVADTWYYFELKVVCNTYTGSYELRISDTPILSATNQNTKNGSHDYHTTFRLYGTTWVEAYGPRYDDLYACDGSGATNNDFLGNVRVSTLRPDGAGDSTQFTPSAGDNYTCVDEVTVNDNTDYVSDGTSGHTDLYTYSDTTLSGIKAIAICTDCRETDAKTMNIHNVCKSGGTQDDGSSVIIGSCNFVQKQRILETDPNTSGQWQAANLNSAQFGVKIA